MKRKKETKQNPNHSVGDTSEKYKEKKKKKRLLPVIDDLEHFELKD